MLHHYWDFTVLIRLDRDFLYPHTGADRDVDRVAQIGRHQHAHRIAQRQPCRRAEGEHE